MFSELTNAGSTRWQRTRLLSFAAHVVVLLLLTHRAAPVFVMPSDVLLGTPNSSGHITYLAPIGAEKLAAAVKPKFDLRRNDAKLLAPAKPQAPPHENETGSANATLDVTANAGSIYGARIPGAPLTGHEIIPALPQVFPDPAVSRADLPPGVQGDVIVEVTIDEQGNVIELKLIRGIGYGIEDRVLATLRQWRFRPASKDGVTIASQHLVTFHYPS